MIPLKTEMRPKSLPLLTWGLIFLNFMVFYKQLLLGPDLPTFIEEFALIPQRFMQRANPYGYLYFYPYRSLVTSVFLHGSWLHLIGNMLTLWVFGGIIEDRLGHLKYLGFYLLCGVAAGVGHIFAEPFSTVPCVGASGAIAGLLGSTLVLHPNVRVVTVVPLLFIIRMVKIPAYFFLIVWFLGQLALIYQQNLAVTEGRTLNMPNIAVTAHVVGFLFGAVAVFLVDKKPKRKKKVTYE